MKIDDSNIPIVTSHREHAMITIIGIDLCQLLRG